MPTQPQNRRGQPRPLVTGRPASMPMHARSLRDQVEAYLVRMRHTLPFPCSTAKAYFGCLPAAINQWHDEGRFEGDHLPGKVSNFLSTVYQTTVKQNSHIDILHVSVEPAEEYLEAQRGNRGHEGIFWMRIPEHLPMPRNGRIPFFLPEDHPFYEAIHEWVEQAFAIEDEIQHSLERITQFQQCVSTAAQIVKVWPELNNFVTVPRGLANNMPAALREAADKVMTPAERDKLTDQLARAVMLPRTSPPLQAWVRFYASEIET